MIVPKAFRPKNAATTFTFPFRFGGKSLATGGYNTPPSGRPSKSMPPIKQFTRMTPNGPRKKPK